MKKKISGLIICALLIYTTFPIVTSENVDENATSSSGLATTTVSNKIVEFQFNNDIEGLNERALPFYGYCAWDPTSKLIQGPVSFSSTNPENITQIAPQNITCEEFISGATWALGKWYGCEFGLGEVRQPWIWKIHPVIGEMTKVGSYDPEGTHLSFNGLAYDLTTGIMYGCSPTDLYRVNMNTGASTLVGNFGITQCVMIGIAFDGSGNLYGTELITDSLYSINPANGEASLIGDLGIDINYAQDIAFDIDTGILYLSAYTTAPVKEGALYTCNTVTGAATKIGTFQGAAEITGFAIPHGGIPHIIPTSVKGGILKIGDSKIQCAIKNIGGLPCTNITIKISSNRGFALALETEPLVSSLAPGVTINVTSSVVVGIGFLRKSLVITAIEDSCGNKHSITKNALLFGLLWLC